LLLPFELILLSKALLQLESTLRRLAPGLDAKQVIRQYATKLLRERAGEQVSLGRITRTALESAELASALPKRLNRITEMAAENALRVKVDAIDERQLIRGVHRVANRITAGLVTSALIVGASLMMQIDAGPTLLGFPLLATVFFLVAALIGFYLVWLALYHDRG
jgi:predicted unusual protein kinase regulating ubiquinone biosynthesis (AarF/ABC1/UbiB family)